MALCSLVCSASGGSEHSFSEHAQAQMGALDYPVECSLFADEETEAWGHSQSGWQCGLLLATMRSQEHFLVLRHVTGGLEPH